MLLDYLPQLISNSSLWSLFSNHLFLVSVPFCFGDCFEDDVVCAFDDDAAGAAGLVEAAGVIDLVADAVGVAFVEDEAGCLAPDAAGVAGLMDEVEEVDFCGRGSSGRRPG